MSEPEFFKAECPFCGQPVEVPVALANDSITCPNESCGKSFQPAVTEQVEPPREFAIPPSPAQPPPAGNSKTEPESAPAVASGQRWLYHLARTSKAEPESALVLGLASAILFIIGCGLVLDGCAGDAEGSAIRQTVLAVEYSSGFIVLGLSVILAALVRVIQKL